MEWRGIGACLARLCTHMCGLLCGNWNTLLTRQAIRLCGGLVMCGLVLSDGMLTCSAQETEAATRQYAVAVGFQNQKLFDSAIDEWRTFLKKFPNDPRAGLGHHYLGTCCLQEKRYPDAIAAFTTVVTKYPKLELMDQSMMNLGIASYGKAQNSKKDLDFAKA